MVKYLQKIFFYGSEKRKNFLLHKIYKKIIWLHLEEEGEQPTWF